VVVVKAIELNGRLFIHARVVGPTSSRFEAPTARCVVNLSEMVARIDGSCVLTDEALERLIVLVSPAFMRLCV
jgi:hypothetical protein